MDGGASRPCILNNFCTRLILLGNPSVLYGLSKSKNGCLLAIFWGLPRGDYGLSPTDLLKSL